MSDAVKCDSCGAFADVVGRSYRDPLMRDRDSFYVAPVPPGWVKIRAYSWPENPNEARADQSDGAVDGEVCSWACAVALVAKHNPAQAGSRVA